MIKTSEMLSSGNRQGVAKSQERVGQGVVKATDTEKGIT